MSLSSGGSNLNVGNLFTCMGVFMYELTWVRVGGRVKRRADAWGCEGMTLTRRGSPASDSLSKELKECVTQVTCQVYLGSTSPSLLHNLKKSGLVPLFLCRPLTAWKACLCSGRAQYMIRTGSAVPVCRVQWSSLHLIFGCQASWGCTLGSFAGLQASWGRLHQVWLCRLNRHCCVSFTQGLACKHLSGALWVWIAHRHLV